MIESLNEWFWKLKYFRWTVQLFLHFTLYLYKRHILAPGDIGEHGEDAGVEHEESLDPELNVVLVHQVAQRAVRLENKEVPH